MSKPSTKPEFATDGGALIGDPGAGKRHAGFIVDEAIPAHWLNWLHNNESKWIDYLDDLPNEPDFTSQNFDWTGGHSFEDELALSGTDNEVSYTPLPRTRKIIIPQTQAVPKLTANIVLHDAGGTSPFGWVAIGAGTLIYTFRLPHATLLLGVRLGVYNGGSADVVINCFQLEAQTATPGPNTTANLGSATGNYAGAGILPLAIVSPPATNGELHTYCVEVEFSSGSQVASWLEAEFADPGPRNF